MSGKQLTIWDFNITEEELNELYVGSVTRKNYYELYTNSESHYCAIINLLQQRGLATEAKAFSKYINDPGLKQLLFYTDDKVRN